MKRLLLCALLAGCSNSSDVGKTGPSVPSAEDSASASQPADGVAAEANDVADAELNSIPPIIPPAAQGADDDLASDVDLAKKVDPNTDVDPLTQQFAAFVENPQPDAYLALRRDVVTHANYRPYSDEMDNANQLLEEGRFPEAVVTLRAAMPNLLLSPSAHQMLAYAYDKVENEEGATAESKAATACLKGILSTGDGTQESPLLVIRTSDEYDVMAALRKSLQQQSLVHGEESYFDKVECTDGTELWFDVTQAFQRLGQTMR